MNEKTGGVSQPNYTQTPNEIYALMPEMKDCELRVVLAVCRATFGWHKEHDRLSLSQLEERTGLSRQGVLDGIAQATERGIIEKIPEGNSFKYGVLVNVVDQLEGKVVNIVDQTSQRSRPVLVNDVDTQKKGKETIQKKEEVKKETLASSYGYIIQLHHSAFGPIHNLMLTDRLKEIAQTFQEDWVREAFQLAQIANAKDFRYVERILQNWRVNGKGNAPPNGKTFTPVLEDPAAVARREQTKAELIAAYERGEGRLKPDEVRG